VAPEASTTTTTTNTTSRNRPSKVPCDICGLLFDTVDIKEEHKKFPEIRWFVRG
jgi:hypothetical protein